jgi:hypothetical protein
MVPKHWRAAGLAPQNLLFPTWLPGTDENSTPHGDRSSIGSMPGVGLANHLTFKDP